MLNDLAREIHQIAVEHGWWSPAPSFGEVVALCHSELSEALEEYRAGRPMVWSECTESDYGTCCIADDCEHWRNGACKLNYISKKPEGIAVEMADCLIRILDWAGHDGVDIDAIVRAKMEYNKTREHRHGGKLL